jgi:hypothetical protein
MKLTPAAIANLVLPPGIDDKIYFDEDMPGFGVRLRRSGKRSLVLQYAVAGRTRKIPLGPVAELGKARTAAKTLLAQVDLGVPGESPGVGKSWRNAGALVKQSPMVSPVRRRSRAAWRRRTNSSPSYASPAPADRDDRSSLDRSAPGGDRAANGLPPLIDTFPLGAPHSPVREGPIETSPVAFRQQGDRPTTPARCWMPSS